MTKEDEVNPGSSSIPVAPSAPPLTAASSSSTDKEQTQYSKHSFGAGNNEQSSVLSPEEIKKQIKYNEVLQDLLVKHDLLVKELKEKTQEADKLQQKFESLHEQFREQLELMRLSGGAINKIASDLIQTGTLKPNSPLMETLVQHGANVNHIAKEFVNIRDFGSALYVVDTGINDKRAERKVVEEKKAALEKQNAEKEVVGEKTAALKNVKPVEKEVIGEKTAALLKKREEEDKSRKGFFGSIFG